MLVWQGWGILVVGVPLLLIVVTSAIWTALMGETSVNDNYSVILGIALLLSAPIIYLLGKRLEARPGRTMVDKETGQEVVLRGAHTLFFVRLRYWAWISAILGAVFLIVGLLPQG